MADLYIYDLTCLISQQVSETPSGTVRVDLRYANYFLSKHPKATIFIRQVGNTLNIVEQGDAKGLIEHLLGYWEIGKSSATPDYHDTLGNFEFRMKYYSLWDPDLDTFFSMPYIDRFNILLHQDLSESLGVEFNWVKRLPFFMKIFYAFLASISRHPAQFLLRFGQFVGVYIVTRRFSNSFKFLRLKTKKIIHLSHYLRNNAKQDNRYHYIYTGYNRGFAFEALKEIGTLVNLYYAIFIHDLIIIYYPEYFFPVNHDEQIRWLKALLTLKPKLIVNSDSTKSFLERFATEYNRKIYSIETIHIGVEPIFLQHREPKHNIRNEKYFVVISTIEPRKNHLLLLNIWREMITSSLVEPPPHLYLIGKRGWENENIIDMVERCRPLNNIVHELSALNDSELIDLLAGSQALLYPSFCEGWGMPIAEALSLGTPIICSDIPELKESGQNIPDYINPIDGKKWMDTIIDYCMDDSIMRNKQLERIKNYRPPTWDQHFIKAYKKIISDQSK